MLHTFQKIKFKIKSDSFLKREKKRNEILLKNKIINEELVLNYLLKSLLFNIFFILIYHYVNLNIF